jgi:hypothetical protein
MRVEDIQQRIQDVNMEVHSLDILRDGYDDVNVHIIEDRITELQTEKFNLQQLLDSCFDQFIGL